MKGTLFIVAAPSGAGKTSLVNALLKQVVDLSVSISHTTRFARPNEQHGVNYFFVAEAEFQQMIADDAFLEHAKVFNHYYGTSKTWVEQQLAAGIDVILEIDWQGARQVRAQWPEAESIFIVPPSCEVLRQRLQDRAQDDIAVIEHRMAEAKAEMSHYDEYDYLVVNQDFDQALAEMTWIIRGSRLKIKRQSLKQHVLLQRLLENSA